MFFVFFFHLSAPPSPLFVGLRVVVISLRRLASGFVSQESLDVGHSKRKERNPLHHPLRLTSATSHSTTLLHPSVHPSQFTSHLSSCNYIHSSPRPPTSIFFFFFFFLTRTKLPSPSGSIYRIRSHPTLRTPLTLRSHSELSVLVCGLLLFFSFLFVFCLLFHQSPLRLLCGSGRQCWHSLFCGGGGGCVNRILLRKIISEENIGRQNPPLPPLHLLRFHHLRR